MAMQFLHSRGWKQLPWWGGEMQECLDSLRLRDEFISRFGFAILDRAVVDLIKTFSPIVEIGCGSGYWSYELNKAGAQVIATDPGTGRYGSNKDGFPQWLEIERITSVEAVHKYPGHAVLTVWPDLPPLTWPADALAECENETVIYVGEGECGATADNRFHALLESKFTPMVEAVHIPTFWGVHDYLSIWKKKNKHARRIALEDL